MVLLGHQIFVQIFVPSGSRQTQKPVVQESADM